MEMKTYTSQPICFTRYIPFDIGNVKKKFWSDYDL